MTCNHEEELERFLKLGEEKIVSEVGYSVFISFIHARLSVLPWLSFWLSWIKQCFAQFGAEGEAKIWWAFVQQEWDDDVCIQHF